MFKDYYGKNAESLKDKKLYLLDMDGTIYMEDHLFDGVLEFLDRIKKNGGRYVFITNNSSKSVTDYISRLNKMGIIADRNDFYTSVEATTQMLNKDYPGIRVYAQGTRCFIEELKNSNINVTEEVEDGIEMVLTAFDTELTMQKLRNTCEILTLNPGIPYYATNPDLVCPVAFGDVPGYIPDCGSMSIGIKNATGRMPIFIGKPEPTMIYACMEKFSYTKEETVVIGDRLYTDIASGNNAGVTTICVLTGEGTIKDIEEGPDKPTFVFDKISDLLEIL